MLNNFNQRSHYVGLTSPVDTTTTTVTTGCVNMGKYLYADLIAFFGTITDDVVVVTLEACSTAAGADNTPIAFNYRKSAAVGTDTYGAITAATTSGVTIAAADDDKILLISINSSELPEGKPFLRLVADPGGSASAAEIAVLANMQAPRHAKTDQVSALV